MLSWRAVGLVAWVGLFAVAGRRLARVLYPGPVVAGAADEAWEWSVEPRLRPFDPV